MRAAWLRCRIPDVLAEADAPDVAPPSDVAPASADPGASDAGKPAARPGSEPVSRAATDHGPVRPAFGHPTF
jgi:hypothetical protein